MIPTIFRVQRFILLCAAFIMLVRPGSTDAASYQAPRVPKISPHLNLSDVDKPQKVWVFFTDKGFLTAADLQAALNRHQAKMNERTKRRRRLRSSRPFPDETDLPIQPRYIDAVRRLGGKLRRKSRWLNGISLEARQAEIRKIAQLPFVRAIDPVLTFTDRLELPRDASRSSPPKAPPSLPLKYGLSETQLTQIHADFLHQEGFFGEGIVVGVLDTGFSLAHNALQKVNVLAQHDFVHNDDDPSDEIGQDDADQDDHGSVVLGILAGYVPGTLIGVAYRASYLLAKTEKVSENGEHFEQQIEEDWWIEGLEWVEEMGAEVVMSSLGYSVWYRFQDLDGKTSKLTVAADLAVEKGMPVIVAVGNNGRQTPGDVGLAGRITVPADGFNLLAIGSVDRRGQVMPFSSRGPTFDGRVKPDLVAMGSSVASINSFTRDLYSTRHSGTSVSTPLAAGVVTLLVEAFPLATPKDIAEALRTTASQSHKPDNTIGYGIIHARAAYEKLLEQFGQTGEPEPIGVDTDSNLLTTSLAQVKRGVLLQNYPNPFNAETWIPFRLTASGWVTIRIYDLHGRELNIITPGHLPSGDYFEKPRAAYWNGRNFDGERVASGSYFYTLEFFGEVYTRRMIVLE